MTYESENDELTLDQVIAELHKAVVGFDEAWREKHAENPVEYPLSIPKHNGGVWSEFFIDYYLNGTI